MTPDQSEKTSLRDVLIYLGRRTNLNSTRIQKLVYLVDAEYADATGRRILSHRFQHDHYGMFSPDLREEAMGIGREKDGPFEMSTYASTHGGRGFTLTLRAKVPDPALPAAVKRACDLVVREYGGIRGTRPLASAAKRTLPFHGTPVGQTVDWSVLTDPNLREGECDHELSDKGRKRILAAMGTPSS